ncbi:MAG: 2,3-bisphosphoglycerate-independent phosphoglycerate mutase [Clostridia bacterium]|nr:2,3-bisphosphoglycerate-independent phosphoglycerate mutase [Clostridia bacterium]
MRLVPGPVALIVLDGWGLAPPGPGNAVHLAHTPNFDAVWARFPRTTLGASGEDVGLAPGQMGNSNVGHLNLGAGRVVLQDLARIDRAVARGLGGNPALSRLLAAARGARLHVWGLVSDGGVHSHVRHLYPVLWAAAEAGVTTFVHAVLDGRDTPPQAARPFLEELESFSKERPEVRTATVSGRYYAMDRDRRWPRVELAYAAMVEGRGRRAASALDALAAAYQAGETDEFVRPTVVADEGRVRPGDVVLCFNFRADRARELTAAFIAPDFEGFRRPFPLVSAYGGFTLYDRAFAGRMEVLFPPPPLVRTLGEVVSEAGLCQLRAAETEKYAHVTYFLNGGREAPFPGEDRILVPSPPVATYDLQPEMSAPEVARQVVARMAATRYDLVVVNFANPDMVGHTGVLEAAVRAVEAADAGLGTVLAEVRREGGAALVLADHGNAEVMLDPETGGPWTAHTTNRVPAVLVAPGLPPGTRLREGGNLGDVAPTLLQLLGLPQPPEMTGRSLLLL